MDSSAPPGYPAQGSSLRCNRCLGVHAGHVLKSAMAQLDRAHRSVCSARPHITRDSAPTVNPREAPRDPSNPQPRPSSARQLRASQVSHQADSGGLLRSRGVAEGQPVNTPTPALQRRGRDSNPRRRNLPRNGFRDRRIQPLCHPSWGDRRLDDLPAARRIPSPRRPRTYLPCQWI